MTIEEAKTFLDNLKVCIEEHPIVADWLVEIADRKTEPFDKDINVRSKTEPSFKVDGIGDDDSTIHAIAHLQKVGWLQEHDRALTEPQTKEWHDDCNTCRWHACTIPCCDYEPKTEPQTEDKHAVCTGCDYYDLPNAFHPCASCVDFSKYKPMIKDEPQTDCSWR